jgi:activating signal cointegrator complex subunit 2
MDREAFASIIYDNFLFDIPKVLDLCVLYKQNPVLNKLIENLFASQPNYYSDFKMCIKDIIKVRIYKFFFQRFYFCFFSFVIS